MKGLIATLVGVGALVGIGAGCAGHSDAAPPKTFHFDVKNYTLPAGDEHYECFFVEVDTHQPVSDPLGMMRVEYHNTSHILHHLVVFTSVNHEVPGTHRACIIAEPGWSFRYAGGTSTGALEMPTGVAAPVHSKELYVFQIHYVNASAAPVIDDTSVDITFTDPGQSYQIASLAIAGNGGFTIPADPTPYSQDGNCHLPAGSHVFGMWPHMHLLGSHFTVDVTQAGVTTTPIDEGWNFGDQKLWLYLGSSEYIMSAGDNIHTTCTWTNTTGAAVPFGESSYDEMCFNFIYYYPAPSGQSDTCGL